MTGKKQVDCTSEVGYKAMFPCTYSLLVTLGFDWEALAKSLCSTDGHAVNICNVDKEQMKIRYKKRTLYVEVNVGNCFKKLKC